MKEARSRVARVRGTRSETKFRVSATGGPRGRSEATDERESLPAQELYLFKVARNNMNSPSISFSCRIYGILIEGEKVLMTRSRFIDREFVNFPGGGIEIGEAPQDALIREYQEETGLSIRIKEILFSSQKLHLSTQRPIQIVSSFWKVEKTGGTLKENGNNDDVLKLFWTELSAIPKGEMFSSDREFADLLPSLLF